MNKVEQLEKALERATRYIQGFAELRHDTLIVDINQIANVAIKDITAILNPPVEMEDLPIERWVCLKCGKSYEYEASLCSCYPTGSSTDSYVPVKLTGTLTRPKPVPVERSITADAKLHDGGAVVETLTEAVFRSHIEAYGKTGTLTFTWTE